MAFKVKYHSEQGFEKCSESECMYETLKVCSLRSNLVPQTAT